MTGENAPDRSDGPRGRSARRWIRALHTYLSLAWLGVLLFFSLTGFALHHGDWFGLAVTKDVTVAGSLPAPLCAAPDPDAIVRILRDRYGAQGALRAFETTDTEVRVTFKRPGRTTDAFIDRQDGSLKVRTETGNAWSMLAALHTGEQSGPLGGWLIDINAIALLLVALTGFVVWLDTPGRHRAGIVFLAAGTMLFGALFLWLLF
jgi:hypothetical protein